MRSILTSIFVATSLCMSASGDVIFSGGNGSPLTVTLDSPITFTANSNKTIVKSLHLLFQGVYTSSQSTEYVGKSGDIKGTGSQGAQYIASTELIRMGVGDFGYDSTPSDFSIGFHFDLGSQNFNAGDTITFNAGTLTSTSNYSNPAPDFLGQISVRLTEGGDFVSFIPEFNTNTINVIPEPSSVALLLLGSGALWVRRKKNVPERLVHCDVRDDFR